MRRLPFYISLLFCFCFQGTFAQSMLINSIGGNPDASAILELESTDQGFLTPRMLEAQRLAISSPAEGLLVYQRNGLVGFYYYNGTGWDTIGGSTVVNNINNVTNISSSGIAVIRDEKGVGVDGGTFTSGAWRQRELNAIAGDLTFVSLGTNSFTLDSGVYVITASAPAYNVDEHQIRLFNSTLGSQAAVGTVEFSGNAFNSSKSNITAVVSVGASGETFIIEHQCVTTNAGDGFGRAAPWAGGESVYTQVKIEKL